MIARWVLVALVGGSGVLHLKSPRYYRSIMPKPLRPYADEVVLVSGVAELVCAAAMVLPPTRRLGGWMTAALLAAVFPANVQAALDGGMHGLPAPLNSPVAAWARLPLQVPLVIIALRVARGDS